MRNISICLLFILSFFCGCAYSGELDDFFAAENSPDGLEFEYIGAGAMVSTEPYIGVGEDITPIPIINARYKRLFVEHSTIGVVIGENDQLRAAIIAKPRIMGYEDDDSSALSGMEDRDWSIDAGLGIVAEQEYFTVKANFVTDILGEHEGHEAEVILSTKILKGFLVPRAGVKWQSKDLIDYYYGVESNEARRGRPAYQGDDAINYIAGTQIRIPFLETWAAVLDVEYEHLDDVIQESPIVNDDNTMTYAGGIVYKF